ncbi:hypothetical protein BU17DRAFT_78981 [Hysterangium stoloniferum]|nr:hypothetical protein BU17DRAFT_78981 [Hysterangium stoloniferum]
MSARCHYSSSATAPTIRPPLPLLPLLLLLPLLNRLASLSAVRYVVVEARPNAMVPSEQLEVRQVFAERCDGLDMRDWFSNQLPPQFRRKCCRTEALATFLDGNSGPPLKNLATVTEKEKNNYEFMPTVRDWACHEQGTRSFLAESNHPEPSAHTIPDPFSPAPVPTSTLRSICTLLAFRIYYPLSFLTQACTCTQQLLAPSIAWLNSGFSVQKPPPYQSSMPPHRSHSLPVVVRRHYLLPGSRLLRLIGHVEVPGSNNPLVHSKVAPASDSGPEPSVE